MANRFVITPRFWSRNGWTALHLVCGFLLLVAGAWVTRDAWFDIAEIGWGDSEESHIFLAPLVAVWVVWVRMKRLRDLKPGGSLAGICVLAIGTALYLVGDVRQIQTFWHAGAILVLEGCFLAIAGRQALVAFLPGFVVLLLGVPVPGLIRLQISLPLQSISAQVTQILMELMGWNVHRSGNVLEVNGVGIAVAEACNGLRMVFALVLVSYAFAFSRPLNWQIRALVLAMSPVLALLANVVRLTVTAFAFGTVSPKWAEFSHDAGGWIMLPLAFVTLSGIVRLLQWAMIPVRRYSMLLAD